MKKNEEDTFNYIVLTFWLIDQTEVRAGKYEDIPDIPTAREAFRSIIFSGLRKSVGRQFYALRGQPFLIPLKGVRCLMS
jgi:hypothetical protein